MTVIELKEKLIAQIMETNNEQLLDHISDLFEFHYNTNEVHVMSEGAIEAVEEGLAQLDRGEWISNEEANRQVEEWLKNNLPPVKFPTALPKQHHYHSALASEPPVQNGVCRYRPLKK